MDSDDDQRMNTDSGNENEENAHKTRPSQNLIAGKIVMVHLKNFLTHTEATVHPSEQLNLVSRCFFLSFNWNFEQIQHIFFTV